MSFQIGTDRIENAAVIGASQYLTDQQKRDDRIAKRYAALRQELIDAICSDPEKEISTPGFAKRKTPAREVMFEHFAGVGTEADWMTLLCLLGAAARGESVHLRAQALLSKIGAAHAEWHCGEDA